MADECWPQYHIDGGAVIVDVFMLVLLTCSIIAKSPGTSSQNSGKASTGPEEA